AFSTSASLNVNSKPVDPSSASASKEIICLGEKTVITLNGGGGGNGEEIKWYSNAEGTNLVGTGNSLEVEPNETTTYYGRYETPAPCSYNSAIAEVTITVNYNSTIELSSGTETEDQTICINNSLVDITYAIGGGATGAILTGSIPEGISQNYDPENKLFKI